MLENESLSVVWYALHPKEEVTVQVVVRVENIVVCVDVEPPPLRTMTHDCIHLWIMTHDCIMTRSLY